MSRGLPDSSLGEVVAAAARRKSTLLAQSKERRLDGTGWPWRVRLYGQLLVRPATRSSSRHPLATTVGELRLFIREQRLASKPVLGRPKAV